MPTLAAIDPVLVDRALALGLLVIGLAQAWPGYVPIVERWDRVDWVAYLFPAAIAVIVPLTVLIRRPRPVLAFFASIALAQFEVPSLATPSIAIALCTYALGRWETPRRDSLIALGTGIVLFVTVTAVRQGLDWWFIVVALTLAGLWWIGDVVRDRDDRTVAFQLQAARHEAERRRDAALAADAERARIARELHDVIAHNVSVMVVQAAAANRVLKDDPAAAGASLSIIETTGREALTEMRRLLGVLRQGEASLSDPQPSLARLPLLIDEMRAAGLPVDLTIEGNVVHLPPGVDLSAYRVVQEALTNVLRHAGPSPTEVAIRYGPTALEIEVCDAGPVGVEQGTEATASPRPVGGHGLAGMRERIALVDGRLEAGVRPGGGFRILARLPIVDG
jgi:signal transduction histidine kinase